MKLPCFDFTPGGKTQELIAALKATGAQMDAAIATHDARIASKAASYRTRAAEAIERHHQTQEGNEEAQS